MLVIILKNFFGTDFIKRMPPPYCGFKSSPSGRVGASDEVQCARQIRAYGKRIVSDVGRGGGRADEAVSLLRQRSRSEGRKGGCGAKTPFSPLASCRSQRRLYGLLPAIENSSDVKSKTYIATQRNSHLPSVPPSNHAYTDRALELSNAKTRGKPLLFVSVAWTGAEDDVFMNPTGMVGGVGFVFGVFDTPSRFHIIRIFTNEAYRGSNGVMFSILMHELTVGVKERVKQLYPSSNSVLLTIDDEAPCFKLKPGSSLLTQYEKAGFTLQPNPVERNVLVRKEVLVRAEGEQPWSSGRPDERILFHDRAFPPDVVKSILHERIEGRQHGKNPVRGGANEFNLMDICEIASSTSDGKPSGNVIHLIGTDVKAVTPREGRLRWDIRLSDAWVKKMSAANDAFAMCHSFVSEEIKRVARECANSKVEWHVMMVLPGCPGQDIHIDDASSHKKRRCYFTFILPLTDVPNAGGTYFKSLNTTFSTVGGYALFHGSVEHAGLANRSEEKRYFLYAAIFTGEDVN